MYLLSGMVLSLMTNLLVVVQFVTIAGLSFWLYFLIGYGGSIAERVPAILILTSGGSTMTFLFNFFGQACVQAVELLNTWRYEYIGGRGRGDRSLDWQIERRSLRTLRPIKVYAGNLYFFDEMAALTLWQEIIGDRKSVV